MAAPSIITFKRNGLPSNSNVNYTLNYSSGSSSSGVKPNKDTYGNTYYSNVSISVACNGNTTSSTTTCPHGARGKDAAQTVTATLSYSYKTVDREWNSGHWTAWYTYSTSTAQEKPSVPSNTSTTQYRVIGSSGDWEKQKRTYNSGYYSYYWSDPSNGSVSKNFSFYAPPEAFSFTNCEKGKTWLVSEGINKNLITNLTNFQAVAKRWKQWKNQKSSKDNCPSFDSPLSAKTMNSIYTYMDLTSNFKTGDKISAKMFNDLADKINNR